MTVFESVEAWQEYISALHPEKIDLGLTRVKSVADRLHILSFQCPVIIVAGTNGKGSTVAALEAIYRAAGYRTGSFSSPYLFRLNEEIRIQGEEATDTMICEAFSRVEAARQNVTLTVFEFITLAALWLFQKAAVEVCLLEVGLGGRLDAVNIIDADLAIVTSIAIDHAERLGHTRELIGREKAGIFREKRPVVCGDQDPPTTLLDYANSLSAPVFCRGRDFDFVKEEKHFQFRYGNETLKDLPIPQLALENIATVLMAVKLMHERLHVAHEAILRALQSVSLPGRIQRLPGTITRIVDVSHNPAAAEFLAQAMARFAFTGMKRAVFSMLADKDITDTIAVMKPWIDEWYIAALAADRAAALEDLQKAFTVNQVEKVESFASIEEAYAAAMSASTAEDVVIIFGSFYTVAAVFSAKALTA